MDSLDFSIDERVAIVPNCFRNHHAMFNTDETIRDQRKAWCFQKKHFKMNYPKPMYKAHVKI